MKTILIILFLTYPVFIDTTRTVAEEDAPPTNSVSTSEHTGGRGEPRGASPPTPPCVRVRTRRFGCICGLAPGEGSEAEGAAEVVVGKRDGKRRAVADPPGTVSASGGLRRQIAPHAPAAQLRIAGSPRLHRFQTMDRSLRLIHWSSARSTEGVSQKPK